METVILEADDLCVCGDTPGSHVDGICRCGECVEYRPYTEPKELGELDTCCTGSAIHVRGLRCECPPKLRERP